MTTQRENKHLIDGPAGKLEVLSVEAEENNRPEKPVAVVCHPHPLYGGSMTNKVVHILSAGLRDMGIPSVRFNFRGVGQSEGSFDDGVGEAEDMLAVVNWARKQHPKKPLWLCGFSFGAYVALRGHVDAETERLLLIAPPVSMYPFADLPKVEVPWMVIQGGQDEVISAQAVSDWVQSQENDPQLIWSDEADHFFHGRLNFIRESVKTYWAFD